MEGAGVEPIRGWGPFRSNVVLGSFKRALRSLLRGRGEAPVPSPAPGPGQAFASVDAIDETQGGAQCRTELWQLPDGDRAAMLFLAAHGVCLVVAVHSTSEPYGLHVAQGAFVEPAIRSGRQGMFDALPWRPASPGFLGMLGVFDEGFDPLLGPINEAVRTLHRLSPIFTDPHVKPKRLTGQWMGLPPTIDLDPVTGHSWPGSRFVLNDLARHGGTPMPAPRMDPGPAGFLRVAPPSACGVPLESAADHLAEWHAEVAALCRPGGLKEEAWTQATYAFLAPGGEVGLRRRQAADLQAVFLPTLPLLPDVVSAIDAGRPFEPLLTEGVNTLLALPAGRRLDMARMRRLRSYPVTPAYRAVKRKTRTYTADDFRNVLWAATALPIEHLPTTPEGWSRIVPGVVDALRFARRWEVDLKALLAGLPPGWGAPELMGSPRRADAKAITDVQGNVGDLKDMVRRFHQTVLAPAGVGVWPDEHEWSVADGVNGAVVAARILLQGRTFHACMALQRDWHRTLSVMDRALPKMPGGSDYTWPALFEPQELGDGVTARCLTTSAELRAEGTPGTDASGMRGLSHCVGGYGKSCAEGESHIVSLVGADGPDSQVRLSTMEIAFSGDVPRIVQHRGLSNGVPPELALIAAAELMHRIERKRVGLNQQAMARRKPTAVRVEGYDLRAAVAAWDPYLTQGGRVECRHFLEAGNRQGASAKVGRDAR
jgi:hypothetical protein